MATGKNTSPNGPESAQHEALSGFESRCLFQRICELRQLVQLAMLGADSARERTDAEDVASICTALELAELQIRFAESLAARQVH